MNIFFSRGQEVYLIDEWPKDRKETALELVLAACLPEGRRNVAELIQSYLILILDESQYTYRDPALWYKFLKIAGGNAKPMDSVKVCLLSSYGSPTTGAPHTDYPDSIIPPVFSNNQRRRRTSCRFTLNVLKNGYAPLTSHDYGLNRSFKRGFVHTTLDPDTRETICVFPSPLHDR